jgi:hypothetical protein
MLKGALLLERVPPNTPWSYPNKTNAIWHVIVIATRSLKPRPNQLYFGVLIIFATFNHTIALVNQVSLQSQRVANQPVQTRLQSVTTEQSQYAKIRSIHPAPTSFIYTRKHHNPKPPNNGHASFGTKPTATTSQKPR